MDQLDKANTPNTKITDKQTETNSTNHPLMVGKHRKRQYPFHESKTYTISKIHETEVHTETKQLSIIGEKLKKIIADAKSTNEKSNIHELKGATCLGEVVEDINSDNIEKDIYLLLAARYGVNPIVKELILINANINCTDYNLNTPLHLASQFGYTDIVLTLLKAKSNIDAKNHDGCTPLHFASEKGNLKIISLLYSSMANENGPPLAKKQKTILEIADYRYETSLTKASKMGHNDCVNKLLELDANVDAGLTNKDFGLTPLFWACNKGFESIADSLLKKNASVNWSTQITKNLDGCNTPLHTAVADAKSPKCVQLLLANGAEVNAKNYLQQSPLHVCCQSINKKTLEIICILISNNANVNDKNSLEISPLLYAILQKKNNAAIVQKLIKNNADVNSFDKQDCAPLHHVVSTDQPDIFELLLEQSPLIYFHNKQSMSPLDLIEKDSKIDRYIKTKILPVSKNIIFLNLKSLCAITVANRVSCMSDHGIEREVYSQLDRITDIPDSLLKFMKCTWCKLQIGLEYLAHAYKPFFTNQEKEYIENIKKDIKALNSLIKIDQRIFPTCKAC